LEASIASVCGRNMLLSWRQQKISPFPLGAKMSSLCEWMTWKLPIPGATKWYRNFGQTRVDQIVQQLKSEISEPGGDRDSHEPNELEDLKSLSPLIHNKVEWLLILLWFSYSIDIISTLNHFLLTLRTYYCWTCCV
jgi:hypothetical protein